MSVVHLYTTMPSPLGTLILTSTGTALTGLYTPGNSGYCAAKTGTPDPAPFQLAILQLNEYFAGKRSQFNLPLAPSGTPFQQRVWQALQQIRYGETKSYQDIALSLNQPTAARAVGMANGKNPLAIIIPCHRVIGKNGALTGYNGGLNVKEWLLTHEARQYKG